MSELCLISLEDAAKKIAATEISPVELTRAVLERIERLQPKLNAFITVTAEQAVDEARAAEREIADGRYRGALHGVPIAHKDLFDTKGVRTTAGTKVLADRVPDGDAAVVERLRAAGAVSVGKLNMHEWAFGTSSANAHYGPVRNPWDTERVPGGSSGGSGAATAAGLAFATTGSDTGGSIRLPASECGCVGLMPTYGRVSLHGAIELSWTLDHAGPLTRRVRDAAIVLQAMAGHDPRDIRTERVPVPDYLDGIERGPKGLRVGVPRQHFWEKIDAEVERLVRDAVEALARAGAEVLDVDFERAGVYSANMGPILLAEAAAYHAQWFPARRDEYATAVAELDAGAKLPAVRYVEAMRVLQTARAGEADAVLDGVDALAVPTVPEPPPTIVEITEQERHGRAAYTSLFDVTGQPVLTVPCGLTESRLPVGISLVARRWDEATLLRAGRAYELVRGEWAAPAM